MPTWAAAFVALAAGWICYGATHLRAKRGWDDSLDVWGVHGIGGLLGSLLVGWFAYASVGGHNGLLAGDGKQFGLQCAGVAIAVGYAFCVSFAILKVVDLVASVQRAAPGAAPGARRGAPRRNGLRPRLTAAPGGRGRLRRPRLTPFRCTSARARAGRPSTSHLDTVRPDR